jgi:cell division protein FtsW
MEEAPFAHLMSSDQKDLLDVSVRFFILSLFGLIIIGLVMIYSASYINAKEIYGSSYYFLLRQFIYLILGLSISFVIAKTKFSFWMRYSFAVHGVVGLFVILTLVPGIATVVKGSARWINFSGLLVQPGELLKYTSVLASVFYFQHFMLWTNKQKIFQTAILMLPIIALIFQPDFGMFILCLVNVFFICYLSPFPRKIFYGLMGVSALCCGLILVAAPYRVARLMSYMDPWSDPRGAGFQVVQSFLAFANGSFMGAGLGNSNEKLFYLPEAHNDFIFSVIGEELGFVGILGVVTLFMGFIFFGFKIASKIEDYACSMFATGAIFSIGFQAFLNMGVVMGILPTKGLTMPFISYGGSALMANLLLIGLFFSCLKLSHKKLSPYDRHITL